MCDMETTKGTEMTGSLVDSIAYKIALFPVSKDADAETKAEHRKLRKRFGMDPDIYKPGK